MVTPTVLLIDAQQAARVLRIVPRRLRELCEQGRIPGARMFGKAWQVPARVRANGALEINVTPGKRGPPLSHRDREMARSLIPVWMGTCRLGVYIAEGEKRFVVKTAKTGYGTKAQLGDMIEWLQNLHGQMLEDDQ